jgi:PAS domain S-box-containing protein
MTVSDLPNKDEIDHQMQKRITELEKVNQELRDEILECKQAEKALREDKNYFHLALEEAGVGIWIRGSDGSWLATSQLNSLFGLSPDAPPMQEDEFLAFIYPDDLPRLRKSWGDAIKEGSSYEQEYRVVWPDGSVHWLASKGRVYLETDVPRFSGVIFDITDHKRAEEEVKTANNMLHLVMNNIPQGIFWKDRNFRYMGCNKVFAKAAGLESPENIVGKTDYDLPWTREQTEWFREYDRRVMENNNPEYNIVEPQQEADGDLSWVETNKIPLHDAKGNVIGILGTYEDITERKWAEEALQESEEKYRNIVETTQEGIWIIDRNDLTVFVNQRFSEIMGYSIDEIIGQPPQKFLSPEFRTMADDRLREHRQRVRQAIDYRFIKKDGSDLWCIISTHQLFDDERKYAGSLGMLTDITERKKAEEALKLLNLYNRSLIEASLDPLVTIGHDGKITDVNKATERVTGYSRNELIGTDFSDYFTEPEKAKKGYQKVFYEGFVIDYELEIRNKNGKVTPVLYNASVYKDESGNVIGVFAAARDITESKKAEEVLKKAHDTLEEKVKERTVELEKAYNLLKESEEGLAEAQKMAHLGNWSWNIETGELCWSDELYRIFGLSPQEFRITYDIFLNYVHPDDREYLINAIKEGLNGSSGSVNCRIILDNGEERILYLEAKVFFYEENTTLQVKGIAQDITEYKKIEYKLRESEEKYRNIIETANEGIGIIDARGIVTFANKKLWDMLGYSVDESYNKSAIDLIEDIDDFKRKIENRRKGNSDVYELKAVRKDGSKFWVLASVKPLFNEKGEYLGSLGMFTDISKRKEAEVTLKKIDIARKKEIHHRIKNNLQVISSLLDLQAEKFKGKQNLKETEVLEAFKESQDRVISMALIHEELHKGSEIDTLNVSHYIKELADNLFLTYRLGNEGISLVMDIEEDTYFDMDTAVPLGIIINELVSNSLKHAFSGRDNGDIRIKLYTEEIRENKTERIRSKTFVLSISDNGIGIPEDIDIVELDSLGIQLITTLVEQLDGELELKRENGTEFIVRFTVTEKPKEESLPVVEDSEATDKTTQLTLHKFCLPE